MAAPPDPSQCGAELPVGRCAEPGLPPPVPLQHFYGSLDFHWIPQPQSVADSHLLSDALRIPSLLQQGCQDYPGNNRPTDGGDGYASYVAAEAGLLKFLEQDKGRAQMVRALTGSPGIWDAGGSHLPGGYVDVKGLSYKACLDQLAPNWRNLGEKLDPKPGWKRVILDMVRIPALVGQPGTEGAFLCHTDPHHTDWDFTMAYVIRAWGMIRTEPDENLWVTGETLKHIFADRAWLQGPAGDIDHTVCQDIPHVSETENHEWLIRTTRLLHNELMPALNFKFPRRQCGGGPFSCHYPDPISCNSGQTRVPNPECDPFCQTDDDGLPWPQVYYTGNNTNNETNGLSGIMHATMSDLLAQDWNEYNARPYSRAQMVGLLNLRDFSTNDETRRLASRLLDFAAIKHVAESMNNLRITPFRRRLADDDSSSGAARPDRCSRPGSAA